MKNKKFPAVLYMYLFSVLAAAGVSMILLAVTAILMDKAGIGSKTVEILTCVNYVASAFAAGFFSGKCTKERKFLWGASAGVVVFGILLLISLCVNHSVSDLSAAFRIFLMMAGGAMIGGMVS